MTRSRYKKTRNFLQDLNSIKLKPGVREFADNYIKAFIYMNRSLGDCFDVHPSFFKYNQKQADREHRATKRDLFTQWDNEEKDIDMKCGRCLQTEEGCHCELRKQKQQYGPDDWQASMDWTGPEASIVEYLDLNARAYDMLPYGNAPTIIKNGTMVRIAMPKHIVSDMLGKVLARREADGKYLVAAFKGRETYTLYLTHKELSIKETVA